MRPRVDKPLWENTKKSSSFFFTSIPHWATHTSRQIEFNCSGTNKENSTFLHQTHKSTPSLTECAVVREPPLVRPHSFFFFFYHYKLYMQKCENIWKKPKQGKDIHYIFLYLTEIVSWTAATLSWGFSRGAQFMKAGREKKRNRYKDFQTERKYDCGATTDEVTSVEWANKYSAGACKHSALCHPIREVNSEVMGYKTKESPRWLHTFHLGVYFSHPLSSY